MSDQHPDPDGARDEECRAIAPRHQLHTALAHIRNVLAWGIRSTDYIVAGTQERTLQGLVKAALLVEDAIEQVQDEDDL